LFAPPTTKKLVGALATTTAELLVAILFCSKQLHPSTTEYLYAENEFKPVSVQDVTLRLVSPVEHELDTEADAPSTVLLTIHELKPQDTLFSVPKHDCADATQDTMEEPDEGLEKFTFVGAKAAVYAKAHV
jgi:hypothetical protein